MSSKLTRRSGSAIVEVAAGMVVIIPLFVLVTFVALEASRAYAIWAALQQGSREAARLLATNYANHPGIATSVAEQQTYGFNPVHINQIINSSAQFSASFSPDPATAKPTSVTVTVSYLSGQYGLPKFPDLDVLNLQSTFRLLGTSRYSLE